mgnify:CR=1 FL=1
MHSKMMKPVNGHPIEKSAELHTITGKIKHDTIVYTVYSDADTFAGFECFKTLKEAQEYARNWND